MIEQKKRLGEIFIEEGIVTGKTVERVLELSRNLNRRFGTMMAEMSLVTGEELANALAKQYGYKVVTNLADRTYPAELLSLIPADVALARLIFPIGRKDNNLALAMADPTDTRLVANIAANNGLVIVPFIASIKDIHAAISRHYLKREPILSNGRTVLVVEDDPLELTIYRDTLEKNGYNVATAVDGMDGFKAVIAEKPQVIITDKVMPKLDGYGFFDALSKIPETMFIPVILITGTLNAEEEARAFEKGFFDFIIKPVREITIITRVKRAFLFYERHYRLI